MPLASAGNTITDSSQILDGIIFNADINASAAIADTKLAQITTASKVHGSSITGLASLPVGAGIIPAANLPASAYGYGQTSRAVASGTGTQTIAHGLGKTPTKVVIHAIGMGTVGAGVVSARSIGTGINGSYSCTWDCVTQATNPFMGQSALILRIMDSGGSSPLAEATISALDSTNITLNFTTMTGTGLNVYIQWEAYA